MSKLSIIQFGDNAIGQYSSEYSVVECRCRFNRTYECCLPRTDAKCDKIELTVVAPGMSDLSLTEWFIENNEQSGRIVMDLSSDINSNEEFTQEIYFENAYCASLSESYDIDKERLRLLNLTIIPLEVRIYDIDFPRPE